MSSTEIINMRPGLAIEIINLKFRYRSFETMWVACSRHTSKTWPDDVATDMKQKQKQKQGLLPVSGLNNLKADGRNRCIPCHADVVVVESRVSCTLTYNHKKTKV